MIQVRDHLGRRAFAFAPDTDPFNVLAAVAWAYAEKRHPVCSPWPGFGCPATEGSYCLDCHCEGQGALDEAHRREQAKHSAEVERIKASPYMQLEPRPLTDAERTALDAMRAQQEQP